MITLSAFLRMGKFWILTMTSYLSLSSFRWSMLRGFLRSARIFFFFSLSVSWLLCGFHSEHWNITNTIVLIDILEDIFWRKCSLPHITWCFRYTIINIYMIKNTLGGFEDTIFHWPSAGYLHTGGSCWWEPSSSWRHHPASYADPLPPSCPSPPAHGALGKKYLSRSIIEITSTICCPVSH